MGKFFFKYRGQIPVFVLVLAFPILYFSNHIQNLVLDFNVNILSVVLVLFGCIFRYLAIGFSYPNTSGRNRDSQVADKLNSMFKKDRKDFEAKWDDIRVFIEYGMLTDEKFYDKSSKFALYKNTDSSYHTFEEYLEKISKTNKNKDDKTIILYTNDSNEQHNFVR